MVVFLYALTIYVGFLYTMMTMVSVFTADSTQELIAGVLILFPPAILAIMVVTMRMIG